MSNPFSLLPQQVYMGYDEQGHFTPNVEYSEGQRPAGSYMPAPYLPLARYNEKMRYHVVVSAGKPVAFDSRGNLVPAGYRIELATYATNLGTSVAAADAAATIRYTATDVTNRVKNAKGVLVTLNEPVVKSFFTGATQDVFVSAHVGAASYNYWRHPGGDGENPTTFNYANFNLQNKVAFNCDYALTMPLVVDTATYLAAPFPAQASFIAAANTVKPGMFVTYDVNSNYVLTSTGWTNGTTIPEHIVGQVLNFVTGPINMLDKVRSPTAGVGGILDNMPGTATAGLPDQVTYAGGYGIVNINLQGR